MGGRAQQTTNQTQTTQLPAEQQTNVNLLQQGARDYYNSGGPKFFPGQTVAQANPQQQAGREQTTNFANGAGAALVGDAVANDRFFLNPQNIFNPQNIPGFQAVTDGVTQGVNRNLTETVLPAIRGSAVTAGGLGGSRQGIAEGLAVGRSSDALAQTLGQLNMGAWQQGIQANQAAANRAPQTFNLGTAPGSVNTSVGAAIRGDEQANIDASRERFNFEQLAPLLNLQSLQSLTGTAGQYGGTTTSSGTQGVKGGSGEQVQQALGTILTAAALFYSHSSLKKDIEPANDILGKLATLDIKKWTYKEDTVSHIGPMAEDFHRVFGVGDGRTLHLFDVLGVLLGAVKELAIQQRRTYDV